MQALDQRDRELLAALQGEIPLVSTPFAFLGQSLDMSEKEVIKRTEKLRREGVIRYLGAQFDARALGYRSCLVAARAVPDRIDETAAIVNAHPGVTQNYRRTCEDFNLWFTLGVSPVSKLGLEGTVDVLAREAGFEAVRPLPTLKLFKNSDSDSSDQTHHSDPVPLNAVEIESVRLLQRELPLQPRPFDALARIGGGISADELLTSVRTLHARGQLRRFIAVAGAKRSGFSATTMGVWIVPDAAIDEVAAKFARHRAVSHCYLRPTYEEWPYNLYTTVHARSVDECESIVNDLAIDAGLTQKRTLYPIREYKKSRLGFFAREADEWEALHSSDRAVAAG